MTTHYKTRAFVFKKNNINESDRIFSVFTDEFGRLDIFAKAIRKTASKLRSGIDIFFMSEIEFIQGKNKKTLTGAAIIEKFDNVPQDLKNFKIANGIGEILDNFIKGEEKDKDVFNLLNEVFYKLNDQNLKIRKCQLLYYYFLWNVLSLLGYRPEVQKCNICQQKLNQCNVYNFCPVGQPVASPQASGGNYINPAPLSGAQESRSDGNFYFSNKAGGIICKKCLGQEGYPRRDMGYDPGHHAQKINSDVVKILRIILSKDWQTLSKLKIEPSSQILFEKISDDYYFYTLSSHSFKNVLRAGAEVI